MYENRKLYELDVNMFKPDPMQPRKHFDEQLIEELSLSIKEFGIIQPIVFRLDENGQHMIVAGERRWQAAKKVGFQVIPAIFIGDKTPEIALVENVLRQNLTPIEECEAFQRLIDEFGYNQDGLCRILGKSKSSVSETLSLNRLPEEIKEDCRNNNGIQKSKLIEIVKEKEPKKMIKLYERAKKFGLSKEEIKNLNKKPKKQHKSEIVVLEEQLNLFWNRLNKLEANVTDSEKTVLVEKLNTFMDLLNKALLKLSN